MATTANDSSAVNNEIADNAKPAETILSTGSLPDGTKYHVRQMRPDDIDEALQVWKEIGLYEGTHTIHSFRSIDPKGFFVAINEKDGSIIGECAGVFSEPSTAFIGLYAVRPNYQGMGVGYAVWKQMMNHIGDANAGLYAVEDHYNTYKYKAGFKVEDTVQVVEFKSTGLALENLETLNCSLENVQLVPINLTNDDLIKKITDYDESVVYFNRSKLLQAVLSEPDCLALAALEVPSERVIGYGTVYKNILNKAMAGPIFADNCEIAETLLRSLIEQYPLAISNGLYFMTPNAVPGGVEMARKLECKQNSILPRLFRFSAPKADWTRIYSITSPNYSTV